MSIIDEQLSSFPAELDQFHELFDLPYGKIEKAKRLTELKLQPTLNSAEQDEVLQLSSELQTYLITPQTWNKFSSALYSVQKFFKDNVQGFIENKQRVWETYIKDFNYIGVWQAGKSYKFQNMVTDSKGDLYLCKKDHTSVVGQPPSSNSSLWVKSSSKGDKGDIGLTTTYKGDWNSSTSYQVGDAVSYLNYGVSGGVVYVAKRANTNKQPNVSVDDWFLYHQIVVGETLPNPDAVGIGTHFIEVLD